MKKKISFIMLLILVVSILMMPNKSRVFANEIEALDGRKGLLHCNGRR